jgi:hypothetical protein
MIDRVDAEMGGCGLGIWDSRSIRSGGYAEGDNWLTAVANGVRRAEFGALKNHETLASGFPSGCRCLLRMVWLIGLCFADQDFRSSPARVQSMFIRSTSPMRSLRRLVRASSWARRRRDFRNGLRALPCSTAHLDVFQTD